MGRANSTEENRALVASRKPPQDGWVKRVFGLQNPRGKNVRRIVRHNRHPRLSQERSLIKRCSDFMHSAARFNVASFERAGMGVQTGILRKKRGMNVQHPTSPTLDETGRQDPHEPGKTNDIRIRLLQNHLNGILERFTVVKAAMIYCSRLDAARSRAAKPPCLGIV